MFLEIFDLLNFTFYYRDPQKAFSCAKTRILSPYWYRSYGVIWKRREEYKKRKNQK